jgi:hypothetical protein
MKKIIAVFFIFLSFMLSTQAWAIKPVTIKPVTKIISQKDAPLKIILYLAFYQDAGSHGKKGIQHEVQYKNTTDQTIVAVQIEFVSFNVWNEFLDRTAGISTKSISPGALDTNIWIATAYEDFSFLTGFAYVGRVRFSDGRIWSADLSVIAKEMRKIQRDFDVQNLKSKPDQK